MNFKFSDVYKKTGMSGSIDSSGANFSAGISTAEIVQKVKRVLAENPNVEKASGKIDIKLKGQGKKTLSFNYK